MTAQGCLFGAEHQSEKRGLAASDIHIDPPGRDQSFGTTSARGHFIDQTSSELGKALGGEFRQNALSRTEQVVGSLMTDPSSAGDLAHAELSQALLGENRACGGKKLLTMDCGFGSRHCLTLSHPMHDSTRDSVT